MKENTSGDVKLSNSESDGHSLGLFQTNILNGLVKHEHAAVRCKILILYMFFVGL